MDNSRRSRSRSRSPDGETRNNSHLNRGRGSRSDRDRDLMSNRERMVRERKEHMARLRAENEEEEQKLSGVHGTGDSSGPSNGKISAKDAIIEVNEEELEDLDEEEQMQKMLGFGGFDSTKGKAVEDNQKSLAKGSAAKNKARKYRQYMNRKGGFNKPLDKMN